MGCETSEGPEQRQSIHPSLSFTYHQRSIVLRSSFLEHSEPGLILLICTARQDPIQA
jgi:hypothetical protein